MNLLQTSLVVLGALVMPAIATAAPANPANPASPAYPDSPANPAHPDYLAAPANPAAPGIPLPLTCPSAKDMQCTSQLIEPDKIPLWTCGYKDPASGNMISFSLYSAKEPPHKQIVLKDPKPTVTGHNASDASVCQYTGKTFDGKPFTRAAVVLHK